jgi:hypothetical protein
MSCFPTTTPPVENAASWVDGEEDDELHPRALTVPKRDMRSKESTSLAETGINTGADMDGLQT